jgi:hypothetical protein
MKPRNPVVRELINNPNRNAGKHSTAKQKALSTANMEELDMEIARYNDIQHGKDLEDFDPITTTPINPATK